MKKSHFLSPHLGEDLQEPWTRTDDLGKCTCVKNGDSCRLNVSVTKSFE